MGLVIRVCDKNAGRFANDLAMGTVMRICDENAGRFANDLAVGTVYEFVTRNAGRFANDLAMGTIIRIWSFCKWPRHGYSHTNSRRECWSLCK